MPTIIDALVVELGLDPAAFIKGQKEADEAFKKTKESAAQHGKQIESSGKQAAEYFSALRKEVIGLFAAFTAGKGLKEFIADITQGDAALGRMAANLRTAPETLGAWGNAVERMGGNAQSAQQSFQGLSDSFNELRTTGNTGILQWLYKLQALGGTTFNFMKPLDQQMIDISKNLSKIAKTDPGLANFFGHRLGLDQGTINLLLKGPDAVRKMLAETKKFAPSKEDIDAAQKLQEAWVSVKQASESLGRSMWTIVSPALTKVLGIFKDFVAWVKSDGDRVKALFVGLAVTIGALTAALLVLTTPLWAPVAAAMALALAFGSAASAITYFYLKWKESGKIGSHSIDDLKKQFLDMVDTIKNSGPRIMEAFKDAFKGAIQWIKNELNQIWIKVTGHSLFGDTYADVKERLMHPEGKGYAQEPGGGAVGRIGREFGGKAEAREYVGEPGKEAPPSYPSTPRSTGPSTPRSGGAASPGGRSASTPRGASPRTPQAGARARTNIGEGSSSGSLTALINEEARKAGIDPRIMQGIRAGESAHTNRYDVKDDALESSWGPFQLNRRRGTGVEFERETGLDLRDPKTIPAQVRWVARYLKKHHDRNPNYSPYPNWQGYHGPRDADPRWGNSGYVPQPAKRIEPMSPNEAIETRQSGKRPMGRLIENLGVPSSAPIHPSFARMSHAASAAQRISNDYSRSHSVNSTSETNIGSISVHTQATDAQGIVDHLGSAINRHGFASHGNYGPN